MNYFAILWSLCNVAKCMMQNFKSILNLGKQLWYGTMFLKFQLEIFYILINSLSPGLGVPETMN